MRSKSPAVILSIFLDSSANRSIHVGRNSRGCTEERSTQQFSLFYFVSKTRPCFCDARRTSYRETCSAVFFDRKSKVGHEFMPHLFWLVFAHWMFSEVMIAHKPQSPLKVELSALQSAKLCRNSSGWCSESSPVGRFRLVLFPSGRRCGWA